VPAPIAVLNFRVEMSARNSNNARKAGICMIEDHPLVREGVVQLINRQDDLTCCGDAEDIPGALLAIAARKPDLVLLDLRLKDGDGLELMNTLKSQYPGLRVLVLSQFDESYYAEKLLRAGARGYVMKEQASEEILNAIRTVLRGEIYLSRALAARLIHRFILAKPAAQHGDSPHLTGRELEVLRLLGSGMSTKEVAQELELSIKTIETYREHLKHKLGLADATELLRYAAQSVRGEPPALSLPKTPGLHQHP
jgi:DNA-binding NarL/FixJ family response regulator